MAQIVQKVKIGRQEPITIADYMASLANGASVSFASPVEGYTVIRGLVYSSRAVTLVCEQGVDDRSGALVYRHSTTVLVAAGTAEMPSFPVGGNFVRLTLSNASGLAADVEMNFNAFGIG